MKTRYTLRALSASLALIGLSSMHGAMAANVFNVGDLVLSIYGNGDGSGSYGDNQASPIVLRDVTTSGAYVSQLVLPQTSFYSNGVLNSVISGEYGSSSEGTLQLSADGQSLTIMGYGVNAKAWNAATVNATNAYGTQALAQTTSLTSGTSYTAVSRVVANVRADGTVDTSTALFNIANTNNPRSVATVNGSSFYISGQGVKGDTTQGVFLAQRGASSATAIYTGTDTRTVSIYNGQLYVSTDSKQPKATGGSSNIAVYGATLPTSTTTPTILKGLSNSVTLSAGKGNSINGSTGTVNLSPENFFFANSTTLYVADGGQPKQGGDGNGGLQKWSYNTVTGTWSLDYTLSSGLNLVGASASSGSTGLIGLTGKVVGDQVQLFTTNSTINDLDQTYLYGISDSLSALTASAGETFQVLDTADAGTVIRGVAFAPSSINAVPEPESFALALVALAAFVPAAIRQRTKR